LGRASFLHGTLDIDNIQLLAKFELSNLIRFGDIRTVQKVEPRSSR